MYDLSTHTLLLGNLLGNLLVKLVLLLLLLLFVLLLLLFVLLLLEYRHIGTEFYEAIVVARVLLWGPQRQLERLRNRIQMCGTLGCMAMKPLFGALSPTTARGCGTALLRFVWVSASGPLACGVCAYRKADAYSGCVTNIASNSDSDSDGSG